jgi:hypothetical protein
MDLMVSGLEADPFSRRTWIKGAAAPAILTVGALNACVCAGQGANRNEPVPFTPDEALAAIYAGSKRFSTGQLIAAHRDMDRGKARCAKANSVRGISWLRRLPGADRNRCSIKALETCL